MLNFPGAGTVVQHGFIVNDVDEAAKRWTDTVGAGPFFILRKPDNLKIKYRGAAADTQISIALGQAGGAQIELIQQHDSGPSVYRDLYPAGKEGFHHMAMLTTDMDATVKAYQDAGFEIALDGLFGTTRFIFVDALKTMGMFIEVVEASEDVTGLFGMIADAHKGWDGSQPIREL